jgi:guanylate kinase
VTARIVVLVAQSGGGKTTIARELLRRSPERFGFSVSATTRTPRSGERDGVDYHFLGSAEFRRRVAAGEFLEWAEYASALYGTPQAEVARVLTGGRHVVLDIEVQGARQVRSRYPYPASVSLFVIPPTPRVLIERLRNRRTESVAQVGDRLAIAVREVLAARADDSGTLFDGVLVNDDLESAVRQVQEVAEHGAPPARPTLETAALLSDFARELEVEAERFTQSARRSS